MTEMKPVHVIGGGMAGCEAAWAAASLGVPVVLHEMRPERGTHAHQTDGLAELVCSNSFRSDDHTTNAVGLLHQEMRLGGSVMMAAAARAEVPAGGALAVDREVFSAEVTRRLAAHPRITIARGEVAGLPPEDWSSVIVATGPLTSPALAEAIGALSGEESLAFFDAIAPIVHADSVDLGRAWFQSRYDKGETEAERTAYLNCPMDEAAYNRFIDALLAAPKTEFKDWERDTPYFEGCLPIEVMAERGRETLRHGPMKPVGLTNPHAPDIKPHAVVQLRRENRLGTLYNLVGFQTKLKYSAQAEVFGLIPGLEAARFARLGGIHRNTFLNSPRLLDASMRLKAEPRLRFAGQITGVEGYVESGAMGMLAGRFAAWERLGRPLALPPAETALGALLAHITGGAEAATFQPMNVNFGLFPPLDLSGEARPRGRKAARKQARAMAMCERALAAAAGWYAETASGALGAASGTAPGSEDGQSSSIEAVA
ncbi:MAG: methylenetetrahydrofolate--tRNA-(uracil(54)-C(5))-methyltransferase (FADH(2)-oxidizing) TrmFO [Pseudomonadota bacterium]